MGAKKIAHCMRLKVQIWFTCMRHFGHPQRELQHRLRRDVPAELRAGACALPNTELQTNSIIDPA